jgi:transcriptional regulator with XRE-family HTH domain
MDMKIDAKRIREERQRRAWSQEHFATLTGLGLRTVQRIESAGGASHESIAAIASVMSIPVDQLLIAGESKRSLAELLLEKRLWILLGSYLVATLVTPPQLTAALSVLGALWILFEVVIAVARWRKV